jgi:hypothetical protein
MTEVVATKSRRVWDPMCPEERRYTLGDRNVARAEASNLRGRVDFLRHWAHYVDAQNSMHSFAVEKYMAHADAVGAWG